MPRVIETVDFEIKQIILKKAMLGKNLTENMHTTLIFQCLHFFTCEKRKRALINNNPFLTAKNRRYLSKIYADIA